MWSSVRLADIHKRVPDYGTEALMKLYRSYGSTNWRACCFAADRG